MKRRAFVGRQIDLDYVLDAALSKLHRHADKQTVRFRTLPPGTRRTADLLFILHGSLRPSYRRAEGA
jgi:hypothetical protein